MADLRHIARRKARKYRLDPKVFVRQIGAESGFNPNARSPAGALGVAQIMPATARGWKVNPLKPRQALDAAAKNMAAYVRQYGSYENALRAYNAGPGAIEASKGYAETNAYVQKILGGTDPGRLGKPRAPRAAGGGRGGGPGTPSRVELGEQVTFDEAGYEKARRAALVGGLIAGRRGTDSILFRSGVLTTTPPSPGDFQDSKLTSTLIPGRKGAPDSRGKGGGQATVGSGQAAQVMAEAAKRLGVSEVAGSNRGRKLDQWQRKYGMVGQPWCGIFAGISLQAAGVRGVSPRIASVALTIADARAGTGPFQGYYAAKNARQGDVFTIGSGTHMGLVEKNNGDGTVTTIEGNTGNGRVERKRRSISELSGVARPRYKR